MKSYSILFPLVFLITSCAPAVPAPTVTAIPPTQTNTAIPTATNTPEPTANATPEPTATATSEPTKIPMPDGWMSIAETKEIGGRQVEVNDKGEGATQIDGKWYPVDVKGCYYKEFFDPANQTDPKIGAIVRKINNEAPLNFKTDYQWIRNLGSTNIGTTQNTGKNPRLSISEKAVDAILYSQKLCLNIQSGKWVHIVDYIQPHDYELMPENTFIVRGVVGWLENEEYITFTYLQKGEVNNKVSSLTDAFKRWKEYIYNNKQIVIHIPSGVSKNKTLPKNPGEYEDILRKVTKEGNNLNWMWNENLADPEFLDWALSENNQLRYLSMCDKKTREILYIKNQTKLWRFWGEQIADGVMPELVIRVIKAPE